MSTIKKAGKELDKVREIKKESILVKRIFSDDELIEINNILLHDFRYIDANGEIIQEDGL